MEQAESPWQFTKPLHDGGTFVTVGKWDITAASDAWLQSQKPTLEKVGGCSGPLLHFVAETACCHRCTADLFPKRKDRKIVKEEDLYNPIEACLYEPVNLAAEVLELKAKYSIPSSKLQYGYCMLMTS